MYCQTHRHLRSLAVANRRGSFSLPANLLRAEFEESTENAQNFFDNDPDDC